MSAASHNNPSVPAMVIVYLCLMALLALTYFAADMPLGAAGLPVALGIAVAKSLLVLIFFMHLKKEKPVIWIVAAAGFLWLSIMLTLSAADYTTRGYLSRADELNPAAPLPALPPGLPARQAPFAPQPIPFENR